MLRRVVRQIIVSGFGSDLLRYIRKKLNETPKDKLREYENSRYQEIFKKYNTFDKDGNN